MLKYIGRRILMMIPILLAVTFVVFTLLYITPGNPAELMLGQNATPEAVAELEEELGLNRPFLVRYADYLMGLLRLDNLMLAVGIASTPSYARIVRASVLSVKDQEYIEAARAIGTSDFKIIVKHVLPNCLAPIIVQATAGVALAILTAAGLSFLGLGIQPPTPEWGSMLSSGRHYIRDNWNMTVFPGLCIAATIFSLNVLGDGLRDALDPKLRD